MNSRFQIRKINWWNLPKPLVRKNHSKEGIYEGYTRIGWVWNQTAYMVNNINHGWIAFVDDQTKEKLHFCPMCNLNLEKQIKINQIVNE